MDNLKIAESLVKIAKSLVSSKPKFKKDDLVKIGNGRKVWTVVSVSEQNWANLYNLKDERGKTSIGVEETHLLGVDEDEVDDKGRDAYQAAIDVFTSGKVVVDYARAQREMFGSVVKITKSGRLEVQTYLGDLYREEDMEKFKPTTKQKGEKMLFSPKLFRREWTWWTGRGTGMQTVKPYKGGKLTWLLD